MAWCRQQMYKNLDEDGRRAMNKSIYESGGTVLSTNWNEVKDKNREQYLKEHLKKEKINN